MARPRWRRIGRLLTDGRDWAESELMFNDVLLQLSAKYMRPDYTSQHHYNILKKKQIAR